MRTNIVLDDELVDEAMAVTGVSTKRAVVRLALTELVERRRRRNLLDLAGKIEFRAGYDHKDQRKIRS